jgi:hypothetical protein
MKSASRAEYKKLYSVTNMYMLGENVKRKERTETVPLLFLLILRVTKMSMI